MLNSDFLEYVLKQETEIPHGELARAWFSDVLLGDDVHAHLVDTGPVHDDDGDTSGVWHRISAVTSDALLVWTFSQRADDEDDEDDHDDYSRPNDADYLADEKQLEEATRRLLDGLTSGEAGSSPRGRIQIFTQVIPLSKISGVYVQEAREASPEAGLERIIGVITLTTADTSYTRAMPEDPSDEESDIEGFLTTFTYDVITYVKRNSTHDLKHLGEASSFLRVLSARYTRAR